MRRFISTGGAMDARMTAAEAIVECLAITDRCARATAQGTFADGYRAAAEEIRACIEARFRVRPTEAWEREIREVEIEARTLARLIVLLRRTQASSPSMLVRRALEEVVTAIDEGELEAMRDAG